MITIMSDDVGSRPACHCATDGSISVHNPLSAAQHSRERSGAGAILGVRLPAEPNWKSALHTAPSCSGSVQHLRLLQEHLDGLVVAMDSVAELCVLLQSIAESLHLGFLGLHKHLEFGDLESVLSKLLLERIVLLLLFVNLQLQALSLVCCARCLFNQF